MPTRLLGLLAKTMILPAMLAAQVFAAALCNEPVPAPTFNAGEKWTWRDERGAETTTEVVQVDGGLTQMKEDNGDVTFYDQDGILQKVLKKNGEVATRPEAGAYSNIGQKALDFPLYIGKQWQWSYNGIPDTLGYVLTYFQRHEVIACEEVTTALGKFWALKIRVVQHAVGIAGSGTYYFWYAPAVKVYVKRQYVLSRYWSKTRDSELVRYKLK